MLERLAPAVLLFAAALRAQEPAPPAAEQDPNALLSTALRRIKTADSLAATVDVKQEPPEEPGGAGGPGGAVVITTEVLGENPPFEGKVEAHRDAEGTVVLLSTTELPGFALYMGQGRTVERTTFEETRFSLDQLRTEVTALLDTDSFTRRILDAKLEPSRDAATGEITFRGNVDRDIVPATEGDMPMMQGRVLAAEATIVVKPDGGLKSAAIKLTRSDPMREMMRGQTRRIVIRGGAGVPGGALPPADDDKKHDIVGGSTTYTFSFEEGGPSERAKAFKGEVERLLKGPPAEGK